MFPLQGCAWGQKPTQSSLPPYMTLTVKGTISVMGPPRVKGGMLGLGSPIYHSRLTLKTLKWALTMDGGVAFALCSSVPDDNAEPSEQAVALPELWPASGPALLPLEQRLCPTWGQQ